VDRLLRNGNVCIVVKNWLSPSAASVWQELDTHPRFFHVDLDDKEQLLNIIKSVGLLVA
jgi:hypothetical protein